MRMILAALSERAAADRRKCCAMTPVRRESQSGRPPGTTRRIVQPLIFYIKFHWWRMLHKVVDPRTQCVVQPRVELTGISTLQDATKPHRQTAHRRELSGSRLQHVDLRRLLLGKLTSRFDAQRRGGDRRNCRMRRGFVPRSRKMRRWQFLAVAGLQYGR